MDSPSSNNRAVAVWLLCITALIAAMILLGGATRLTGSGLSITEWRPVSGLLPPLSEAAWEEAFALYRQIPEYRLVNPDMEMEAFRRIYWWEWSHRAFGRLIGAAFVLPLLWFLFISWRAKRRRGGGGGLSRRLLGGLVGILLLGGAQGVIGWLMVASGLEGRVDVAPSRLALHLGLAFLLMGLCFGLGLRLLRPLAAVSMRGRRWAGLLLAAIFAQIVLGALVAGGRGDTVNIHAAHIVFLHGAQSAAGAGGLAPALAEGIVVPSAASSALWLTLHQGLAYGLVGVALLLVSLGGGKLRLGLAAAVLAQAGFGLVALHADAPLATGLLHQGGGVVVFLLAVAYFCDSFPLLSHSRKRSWGGRENRREIS